jgi:hypothetical protein
VDNLTRVIGYANKLFQTELSLDNATVGLPVKLNDATGFEDPDIRNTSVRFTNKLPTDPKLDLVLEYNRLSLPKLAGLKSNLLVVDVMPTSAHQIVATLSQWLGREVGTADIEDTVPVGDGDNATLQLTAKANSYGVFGTVQIQVKRSANQQ